MNKINFSLFFAIEVIFAIENIPIYEIIMNIPLYETFQIIFRFDISIQLVQRKLKWVRMGKKVNRLDFYSKKEGIDPLEEKWDLEFGVERLIQHSAWQRLAFLSTILCQQNSWLSHILLCCLFFSGEKNISIFRILMYFEWKYMG